MVLASHAGRSTTFNLLGVTLDLRSSDPRFAQEFATVFGGTRGGETAGLPDVTLCCRLDEPDRSGWGRVAIEGDTILDGAAFLLGFSSPTIPLRPTSPMTQGWTALALGDDPSAMFEFRQEVCRFRAISRWRRIVAHYVFLRMIALRQEALFFHAASVGLGDTGVLLIGPKGSGKSTLSLGLAARGHMYLGDETAAYVPASGQILPFRRPAGIKPGPRAAAVERALARVSSHRDEEGILRVAADDLFNLEPARAVRLGAVVFLSSFAETPSMESITPGRDELALMQPMATTLSNAPATSRVFAMIRLLSSVRCYKMTVGDPDKSVQLLEEVFAQ